MPGLKAYRWASFFTMLAAGTGRRGEPTHKATKDLPSWRAKLRRLEEMAKRFKRTMCQAGIGPTNRYETTEGSVHQRCETARWRSKALRWKSERRRKGEDEEPRGRCSGKVTGDSTTRTLLGCRSSGGRSWRRGALSSALLESTLSRRWKAKGTRDRQGEASAQEERNERRSGHDAGVQAKDHGRSSKVSRTRRRKNARRIEPVEEISRMGLVDSMDRNFSLPLEVVEGDDVKGNAGRTHSAAFAFTPRKGSTLGRGGEGGRGIGWIGWIGWIGSPTKSNRDLCWLCWPFSRLEEKEPPPARPDDSLAKSTLKWKIRHARPNQQRKGDDDNGSKRRAFASLKSVPIYSHPDPPATPATPAPKPIQPIQPMRLMQSAHKIQRVQAAAQAAAARPEGAGGRAILKAKKRSQVHLQLPDPSPFASPSASAPATLASASSAFITAYGKSLPPALAIPIDLFFHHSSNILTPIRRHRLYLEAYIYISGSIYILEHISLLAFTC